MDFVKSRTRLLLREVIGTVGAHWGFSLRLMQRGRAPRREPCVKGLTARRRKACWRDGKKAERK